MRLAAPSFLPALLILASACGGGEASGPTRVASADGRLVLAIPDAALQGVDVDRGDIKIRAIPIEPLPEGSTAVPFDAAYALLPDGLELAEPAKLEFHLEPDELAPVALHISAGEEGQPQVEFLELSGDERAAEDERTVLVAEVDHFSEIPIWSNSHGSLQVERVSPKKDALKVIVGERIEVGYRVTRSKSTPTRYFWPSDGDPDFRYKVTVEAVSDAPWSADVIAGTGAPLVPEVVVLTDNAAAGDVIEPTEALFTCDKAGATEVGARIEKLRSTLRATIEQLARGGKPTGQTEVVETSQVRRIDPDGFGFGPSARTLNVECVLLSDLSTYLTGLDPPGESFIASPVTIYYENGSGCGAVGQYSYPHTLKFNGLKLKLGQLGHGNALDAFQGVLDPETGEFRLDINPEAPYDAGYEGQLEPDGSASGTYEFTFPESSPQGGCKVKYEFSWKELENDLLHPPKGQ